IYFDIIKKKTASLISACCTCGAVSAGSSREMNERLKKFGENVGIAFQIKDDLFDYEKHNTTGKPNGIDIKEQKMTLPLIHMLDHAGTLEKRRIINIIKNHNDEPDKVSEVINKVNKSGGIEYAKEKMIAYRKRAIELLNEFPESPARASLEKLVIFTTERKK
ncbi:MAG: polyprenyl synthetase family protein, partial [Bacteroidales bacterium]|nr:polyprenyl synthetase family protein [Bacteroidales bacterium]